MGLARLNNTLSINELKNYLDKHGPVLMLRRYNCPNPKYKGCHAIIMTGIHSNGIPECTTFDITDSWAWDDLGNPISVRKESWSFQKLFECQWDLLAFPVVNKSQSNIIEENKQPNFPINKDTIKNNIAIETEKTKSMKNEYPIGIKNGNFNTNEGWNTTNGESIFEKGKVSLKPDKNGTPVKLFSNAFNISANTRQLKLKIAKNLVGKGEIKVSLKNVTTNATDDVYSSKINNVVSKIDNILTNTNKILDGNLNLKKIEPVFEAITIDISKFAGTAVSLEIYFTNAGTSKQPIIIDGITIN